MIETALAWALIHSLWQGTLLGFLVLSVLAATRDPRVRCGAGLTGMLALLTAFCATFFLYLPQHHPLPEGMSGFWLGTVPFSATVPGASGDSAGSLALAAPWLSWMWLAGVCVSHLWQLTGMLSVRLLKRRENWPASDQWHTRIKALATSIALRRSVLLLESARVNTPVVIGHLRPVILVPAGLLTGLPAPQVEAVLLHELAHVLRSDYLINLFQRWVEGLFFYHPVVWWMSATVRRERENCCDDIAAEHCAGDRYGYAQALAALEQRRILQPALGASGGSLVHRVQRLLRREPASGLCGFVSSLTILAATAALAFAGWESQHQPAAPPQIAAPAQTTSTQSLENNTVPPPKTERGDVNQWAWNRWLNQDVVYIIEPAERRAFERLQTDAERQQFVEQFWARREALGASRRTSVKKEHYRRIEYANARFAGALPGWRTDRGRIYIVLGPPAEIESHPSGQNGGPPFEMWKYPAVAGVRPSQYFTFVDAKRNDDYALQTSLSPSEIGVANRMVRWVVTNAAGEYVSGLEPQDFEIQDSGGTRRLTYFQAPGGPAAVAVVSSTPVPFLADMPVGDLMQTSSTRDALDHLRRSGATRKILIAAEGGAANEGTIVHEDILRVTVDRSRIRAAILGSLNQYIGGYATDTGASPEITVRSNVAGSPLRVTRLM